MTTPTEDIMLSLYHLYEDEWIESLMFEAWDNQQYRGYLLDNYYDFINKHKKGVTDERRRFNF